MRVILFKKKDIKLGEQLVSELTILEYKKWFSLKLFYFHKTEGAQDRFHTHAFNAYSFLIKGDYIEEVIEDNKIKKIKRSRKKLLFIPKDTYHRITKSEGCYTVLLTGRWGSRFKELRETSTKGKYLEVLCGDKRKDIKELGTKILN